MLPPPSKSFTSLTSYLAAVSMFFGVSCKSQNTALVKAGVKDVRLGNFTAVAVNEAALRKEFAHTAFKKSLGVQVLNATALLAGGVAAGAIGGQGGVNNYTAIQAGQKNYGLDANGAVRANAAKSQAEEEIALQTKMQQLLPNVVKKRLEQLSAANALVKSKIKPAANFRLDVRLDVVQHDEKHGEHYLVTDATMQILSSSGQCLWSTEVSGESYRKAGNPQAPIAKSAAELLASPALFEQHLNSAAGSLALAITEELADLAETIDEAAAKP